MTNRQRAAAVLGYRPYDRLPLVHFGFWDETLRKWCAEGYLKKDEIDGQADGNEKDRAIGARLGFDFNWQTMFGGNANLMPLFETKVLEELPGGMRKAVNQWGMIILEKPGVNSIPSEVDHLLKDRKAWEEHYLPKLEYRDDRVDLEAIRRLARGPVRTEPLGLHCGSLFGAIRDWIGVQGLSYLSVDDEPLFDEMLDIVGELCFKLVEKILSVYADFDFAHFWEDICFKNGPLVIPSVFREKVGPHYRRITGLARLHGITVVSLDCDGMIDTLIPTWVENGVNTMFPIEVGTWGANIKPWREKYGKELRGVGGMNKTLFARDRAAIDAEVERLKPLVALGGYIPCPDHRIAPDAKWDNVHYYCERMRTVFG